MQKLRTLLVFIFFTASFELLAKEITVNVNGMVCGFCAQGIEKKFKELAQVDSLKISIEKKTVTILTKGKQDISDENISELLDDAGYTVAKIERDPKP